MESGNIDLEATEKHYDYDKIVIDWFEHTICHHWKKILAATFQKCGSEQFEGKIEKNMRSEYMAQSYLQNLLPLLPSNLHKEARTLSVRWIAEAA
jgi:hypothetical protein